MPTPRRRTIRRSLGKTVKVIHRHDLQPVNAESPLQAPRGTRLQLSISGVFALLILPALGAVIAFSYYENARNLTSVSKRFIDRARDDALDLVSEFLDPVGATLRIVSAVASTSPERFRAEESRNILYEALTSAPQID